MELQKGNILACWDNSLISRVIRWITKSRVSHVAVMYDDALVIESWWNGVRIVKLSDLKKRCNFYGLICGNLTKQELDGTIEYLQNSYESKYDFIQIITIGLHKLFGFKIKDNNKKYICSELVWEAYKSVGIDIAPQVDEKDDVVPGDLLNSKRLYIAFFHMI